MKNPKKYLVLSLLSILLSNVSPILLYADSPNESFSDTTSSTDYTTTSAEIGPESYEIISSETTISSQIEDSTTSYSTNVSNSEIPQYLRNNPFFPSNPSEKDLLDDAIQPFTTNYSEWENITLEDRISADSIKGLSEKNQSIVTFPLANIVTDHYASLPQNNYADGRGKPRGIVIHETANPTSTIQNEIAYMKRNWQNAFVHAFVDQNNIIEVAPTEYIAWGAGRNANPYYLHIELVEHVGNRAAFYKSINNQAYYAAYNLKKYNLTPSRAQTNGTGSIWGHFEVSNFLGGTDHGDPLDYFATFGYTFQELYDLIAYHYNNTLTNYAIITSEKNIDLDGILKNDVSGFGIHDKPWNTIDSTILSYATGYANQRVHLTKEATTSFGETYYYFEKDGKEIGWVNKNSLQVVDRILDQTSLNATAEILPPTAIGDVSSYAEVPGTQLSDTIVSNNLIDQHQIVNVSEKITTVKGNFFKCQIGNAGDYFYYSEKALKLLDAIEYDKAVEKKGIILPNRSADLVTANIYNTTPNEQFLGTGKDYENEKVDIIREAKTTHASWYQFAIDGETIGWMNQRAFKVYDTLLSIMDSSESKVIKSAIESSNYDLFSEIPNIGLDENELSKASSYANRKVISTEIATTSSGTYYHIQDISGNILGWLNKESLSSYAGITTVNAAAHVQNIGWQVTVAENTIIGTTGKNLQAEAFTFQLIGAEYDGSIEYTTHVENLGWLSNWAKNGDVSGTIGKNLQIEAIKLKLTGELANHYDIYYQAHIQNFGWLDWAKNGESAGNQGYNYHLEALKVVLVKKGSSAPGNTSTPFKFAPPKINTKAHVSNIGWQNGVSSNQIAGTVGRALSMEAFSIKLTNNTPYDGDITYQAHVTNNGWLQQVSNNVTAGTTGQKKSLQALSIELTGNLSNYYDIFYRVHVRNKGWLAWTKNGEKAGSIGMNLSAEAIQVTILEKGKYPAEYMTNGLAFIGQVNDSTSAGKFINSIINTVQTIAPKNDLYSSVMLAQAILESGYGASRLAKDANNYFGMKFKDGEDEGIYDYVEYVSNEEIPGIGLVPVKSRFRKYRSQRDSFLDNALKLTKGVSWDSAYYAGTWRKNCHSYKDATAALQGRYATSSTYASSLNSVIANWRLDQFD